MNKIIYVHTVNYRQNGSWKSFTMDSNDTQEQLYNKLKDFVSFQLKVDTGFRFSITTNVRFV